MGRVLKVLLVLVVVLVVLAGVGYFGIDYYSDHRLKVALDEAIERLPPEYQATYQSVHYGMLTGHGKVGGIRIQHTIAPNFAFTIEAIDIDHPNLDAGNDWAKDVAAAGTLTPETVLPVANAIEIHGIAAEGDKFKIADDSLLISAPRLYPWSLLRPGLPTMAQAIATVAHQPPEPADILLLFKLDAAYILGFGHDSYTLHNYHGTVTVPATPATDTEPATPEQKVTYSIADIVSGKVERGVMDSVAATGIKFQSDLAGGGTIDKVHIDHFDVRQPAINLLSGTELAPALANGLSIGAIGYDGVKFQVLGKSNVEMGAFEISNIAFDHGVPISGGLALRKLKLAEDQIPDPRAAMVFDALGLKAMNVSFGIGYQWNVATKRLDLKATSLKVDELGTLQLGASAGEMDPAGDWQHTATLIHAKLRYVDASLAGRLMKYGAKMMATDEAGMRDIAIKAVNGAAGAFPGSPRLQHAAQQAVVFLNAPQSMTIEVKPDSPMLLSSLADAAGTPPPELAKNLALQVRANTPQ